MVPKVSGFNLSETACGLITCQFGAFLFGARQFDACQFGAFHFDAVPVRRVSVWRDASLARFTLPCFPFLCLNCTEVFSTSVWLDRVCEYGVARVAYKFVGVPFCEEVFLCAYLFFAYFPLCVVHHLFINLVNVHRGYTIEPISTSKCLRYPARCLCCDCAVYSQSAV